MIKVYRYGLLAPTTRGHLVAEQMLLAHRYRNTLTEIERGRRAAQRALISSHADMPALEAAARAAQATLDAAIAEVSATRKSSRSKSETAAMREAVREARGALRIAKLAHREARVHVRDSQQFEREEINDRALELAKNARHYCGVHWGTYRLAEDEIKAAQKMPLYDGVAPNDPRFVRWQGEGAVSVQLQGGLAEAEAFGEDTQLRIAPVGEWRRSRGGRLRAQRTTLALRVGSDEQRGPIWAEWPLLLHRPLPAGAQIKRATVHLRMIGPRPEWSVCLTVASEPAIVSVARPEHAVAIDLGWRVMGDEIRVAAWLGTDGARGEVRLDPRTIGALRKADELRGLRDEKFNTTRAELVEAAMCESRSPPWLTEAARTLSQWRSSERLRRLALTWRCRRFAGDDVAFALLESWRYRDHHLWAWETSQRTGSRRARREVYRMAAARLAGRYERVVLEDFDMREVAKTPGPEAEGADNPNAQSNRQLVAPSELRLCLANAFGADRVATVSGAYTTRTCPDCGYVAAADTSRTVHIACSSCGVIRDQDEGAAANILERWRAGQKAGGAREADVPEIKETRWERARRMKSDKDARREAARKAVCNSAE